jgi:hypothetical protein
MTAARLPLNAIARPELRRSFAIFLCGITRAANRAQKEPQALYATSLGVLTRFPELRLLVGRLRGVGG